MLQFDQTGVILPIRGWWERQRLTSTVLASGISLPGVLLFVGTLSLTFADLLTGSVALGSCAIWRVWSLKLGEAISIACTFEIPTRLTCSGKVRRKKCVYLLFFPIACPAEARLCRLSYLEVALVLFNRMCSCAILEPGGVSPPRGHFAVTRGV